MKSKRSFFITLLGTPFLSPFFLVQALAQPGDTPPARPAPVDGAKRDEHDASRAHWVIVLAAFRGDDRAKVAAEMLKQVQSRGVPTAYTTERGPAVLIALGQFKDPTSREAQDELARVRAIEIDRVRPFALAFFSPPDTGAALGGRPQYNLLKAHEQFGEQARFSLQVAAYGPADLQNPRPGEDAQARDDAEKAAAILRAEGELAFYYHGPNYSMVTIGVWDESSFGDRDDPMDDDPTLKATQKRFPYSLYNGGGVRVTSTRTGKAALQRSMLVKIPEP